MEKEKLQIIENSLPVGTTLSGKKVYHIEAVLGAGGFGITYRAYSITMDGNIHRKNYYAIKEYFMKGCYRDEDRTTVLCPPSIKHDIKQGRDDFEDEAGKLMNLGNLSNSIVKVNEVFKANATLYYVMEYLGGGDLETVVRNNKGGLPESRALSLIIPIAHAVSLLHSGEKRILHLDIKPDNIVMKTDEINGTTYPVLIDFGAAKHFDKNGKPTSLPTAKGATAGFAPIEQYDEISEFDARLDVYALGATLFYLLTGKYPIKSWDVSNQYILTSLPESVSGRTRNAVKNAMQKDKSNRTPSVAAFLKEIEQTYTLPLYYELGQFRITEILSEDDCSIVYKALLHHSIGNKDTGRQVSWDKGTPTDTLSYYMVRELFLKNRYTRNEDGTINNPDLPLVKTLFAKNGTVKGDTPWSSTCDTRYMTFARYMDLPEGVDSIPDERGGISKMRFLMNGTMYYVSKVERKPSALKAMLDYLAAHDRKVAMWIVALTLLYISISYISHLPQPSPKEDLIAPEDTSYVEEFYEEEENDTVLPPPAPSPTPTNEELFAEAKTLAEFKSLADKGYIKAYYPLAEKYYSTNNLTAAQQWAEKAVKAKVDSKLANALIAKIKKQSQPMNNDELFAHALKVNDWETIKALADKGYEKAYLPLAKHYLKKSSTHNLADKYAKKGLSINPSEAEEIIGILKAFGFYD